MVVGALVWYPQSTDIGSGFYDIKDERRNHQCLVKPHAYFAFFADAVQLAVLADLRNPEGFGGVAVLAVLCHRVPQLCHVGLGFQK